LQYTVATNRTRRWVKGVLYTLGWVLCDVCSLWGFLGELFWTRVQVQVDSIGNCGGGRLPLQLPLQQLCSVFAKGWEF
jgi:hypothetical protein